MSDRRPGSAGAEQYDVASPHVRKLSLKTFGEARPVSVVPDRTPAGVEDHGVHGAERAGLQ
jgi:hypothetical protein